MCYHTLLKVTKDLGLWHEFSSRPNLQKLFSQESGETVVRSDHALQHVAKSYKRFRTLVI